MATATQNANIRKVRQAAKELRYAGFNAKADHGMVQVIVKGITDFELQRLQNFYSVALIAQ